MKKKLVSLLLVSAMAFGTLAGCGNSNDSKKADTKDAGESKDGETKDVSLTVWSPQEDQDTGWLKQQCEAFNEAHPEWNVTFTYGVCPEGEAKDTVKNDVEGSADVYMLANDNIPDLVSCNGLAEIGGSYLDDIKANNSESIVSSVTYNDAVVAFPFTSNTWFMYYDKSVFSEDDIKSLDTMLEKGKVSFPITNSWYIQAFYAANGCTLFGDGTKEDDGIDFGGDKGVAVTNYLVDLVANPNFVNDADGAGIAGLRDKSVNAIFSGTWDADAVEEALGENMGVAALPTVKIDGQDQQMKSFMGSKAVGVNPHAKDMEVAMSLAAYLTGEESQLAHYEMRNVLPSNTNIDVSDNAIAEAVADVMKNTSIVQPLVSKMGNYWSPAENMGKAIFAGEVTHDNAADKTEEMNTAMNTDAAAE
ncbi:extracellular solute-binding protein [Roseburia sp. MSJ-14]|uniref:extracellular solute-binding protein n=1 Tax=Roseburia sp. MSJ-14 TaxID=2841514 RepID=UPI001C11F628|nr:extracellular solute-binding protein [Roseburia sp. MSJ-14]MBU5473644.1 extracellular solute-binding protein [Roseburia sp. MSJ-14]